MNTEERQTHIWQAIARRAFSPPDPTRQANWLQCFNQSVFQYVDNPDRPRCPSRTPTGWQGSFGNRSLLVCKYVIGPHRSQFDLLRPEWHAQYGIETTVFAPCCPGGEEVDDATDGDTKP